MGRSIQQNSSKDTRSLYRYAISATVLTFLVFCLDEGANNFNWITNYGNWIVFVIYASFVLFGQVLFAHFILKKKNTSSTHLLCILVGGLFGFMLAVAFFLFVIKP